MVAFIGFVLVVAACGSSDEASPVASQPDSETSVTTEASTPSTDATTTTEMPGPTEYPPGVIWEQSVVSDTIGRTVRAVEPTPTGWILATNTADVASPTPAVFTSTGGGEWTRSDLPLAGDSTWVIDVVYGPAGYVAIGFAGQDCRQGCRNGNGVVWVSEDAVTWELVEPVELSGPNKVRPRQVRVIDERYVIVGKDEQDGTDWVGKVWSSTDGLTWELNAVLDDPEWPIQGIKGFDEWDGGYVITSSRAPCSVPFVQGGFGWVQGFVGGVEAMAWVSPDGIEWTEMDLAAMGLIELFAEEACTTSGYFTTEVVTAADGTMQAVGGRLFWQGGITAAMELDAATSTWNPSTAVISSYVSAEATVAGTPVYLLADDQGFIAAAVADRFGDKVWVPFARSEDLVSWQDWDGETTLLPAMDDQYYSFDGTFVVSNGTELLAVYQGSTSRGGEEGPIMALISGTAPIPNP
jgi:hypothetical protein